MYDFDVSLILSHTTVITTLTIVAHKSRHCYHEERCEVCSRSIYLKETCEYHTAFTVADHQNLI